MPARVLDCPRSGSRERRPNGKGCAECNRRPIHPGLTRAESYEFARLLRDDFEDIAVTPAMRAYLTAFDAWLMERWRSNRRTRLAALEFLKNDRR